MHHVLARARGAKRSRLARKRQQVFVTAVGMGAAATRETETQDPAFQHLAEFPLDPLEGEDIFAARFTHVRQPGFQVPLQRLIDHGLKRLARLVDTGGVGIEIDCGMAWHCNTP